MTLAVSSSLCVYCWIATTTGLLHTQMCSLNNVTRLKVDQQGREEAGAIVPRLEWYKTIMSNVKTALI